MPVITLYLPPDGSGYLAPDIGHQLQEDCQALCVNRLGASPEKIQVQLLATHIQPLGQQMYAEVKYRHQPHRDAELMTLFMAELEQLLTRHCPLSAPWIRCFPQDNAWLYARN